MKIRRLALLFPLLLGLAPMATAQREAFGLSIGGGAVTVGARLGHVGLRLGFGDRGPSSYRSSSRYVSSVHCPPTRVWIEGCYRTEFRDVRVPARIEKRWVEPLYQTRYDSCGRAYRVLVRSGCWTSVEVPAHYERRAVRVWVPGHWEVRR